MDDERVVPDWEEPMTGEQLVRLYEAAFLPLEREDVDLMFDPDDYPVL